jgi:hypothetical protein
MCNECEISCTDYSCEEFCTHTHTTYDPHEDVIVCDDCGCINKPFSN